MDPWLNQDSHQYSICTFGWLTTILLIFLFFFFARYWQFDNLLNSMNTVSLSIFILGIGALKNYSVSGSLDPTLNQDSHRQCICTFGWLTILLIFFLARYWRSDNSFDSMNTVSLSKFISGTSVPWRTILSQAQWIQDLIRIVINNAFSHYDDGRRFYGFFYFIFYFLARYWRSDNLFGSIIALISSKCISRALNPRISREPHQYCIRTRWIRLFFLSSTTPMILRPPCTCDKWPDQSYWQTRSCS